MKRGELSWFLFDDLRSACEGRTQDTTRGCKNSTTIPDLFAFAPPSRYEACLYARARVHVHTDQRARRANLSREGGGSSASGGRARFTMRPTTMRLRPPAPGDAAKAERKAGVERARVHARFGTAPLRVRVPARQARVGRLPHVRATVSVTFRAPSRTAWTRSRRRAQARRHEPRALRSVLLLPEWTGLWTCVQRN